MPELNHRACWAAVTLACVAQPAAAQTLRFDVPAQPAVNGIPAFSRQAGVQIVAPARKLAGKRTNAVNGTYSVEVALAKLLAGTGLRIGLRSGTNISLVPDQSDLPAGVSPAAAPPAARTDQSSDTGIGDIVVTATRRSESSQNVPAALTVIRGSQLAERNIRTVNDIENSAPSLEATAQLGTSQTQFAVRGVGLTDYAANNTGTVGVYIDEVNHPYAVTFQGSLFDIDRVEVLRGPQGTLFGRNTTAGVVSITTAAPQSTFGAALMGEYGRFDAAQVEGYVTGPLSDSLAGRLAFNIDQGGAWQIDRTTGRRLGDRDRFNGRVKLAWRPGGATQVDLSAHYDRDRSDGRGLQLRLPFQSHNFPPLGIRYPADTSQRATGFGISPIFAQLTGQRFDAKPNLNNEGYGASVRLRHDFGWAELTAIIAHEHFDRKEFQDFDATNSNEGGEYFFNKIDTQSEEVRLASPTDRTFRYLVGVYRSDEHNNGGFMSDFTDVASLRNIFSTRYRQPVRSTGVFANGDLALSDRLTFSLGGRYEHEVRKLDDFISEIVFPVPLVNVRTRQRLARGEWSGKAALTYRIDPNVMLFADIARGVKSGGFTTYNSGLPGQISPFNPEKLLSYEAGFKSTVLNRRLQVNATGFYYDYRDQQLQGVIFSQTQRIGRIINVPRSHIYGGEVEIIARPVDAVEISQSIGYKTGQYDEFIFVNSPATIALRDPVTGFYNTIVTSDQSGEPLPNFPRFDYKGAASVSFDLGGWKARPEINYNHRSSTFLTTSNTRLPGYWLVNANLTLTAPDGRLWFGGYVNNLTNARFYETANAFVTAATFTPHEVITYGIRAGIRY
ncbi:MULTISPECIES: TonB-dependent receptor [Alphaproteobacteria]|jgi:hypothetical protein|uniref:TonB-dependent receptor n=2 Tax=Sphingomonas paucimobilis TaxID=13689 RepID=A0A7Y2PFF5_SPHPI|nr:MULTISPECIES: TonB-dependent receptor [Alphaproteobacteria]NNG59141.1 TonB-dependent receptor [Sphingomonas paucimobilis]QPS18542.1 TonB-dependent receptor [Sphingomonas paucimobilis]RSV34092.1 TonB-dependent receptor [Sphingomonas sp. ABOLE]GAN15795.1 putative TonB-dependent receptor [Sphingomonas paucimobilis NBRC 13935]